MTRAEHLQWAKDRALEYVDMGQPALAIASLLSDCGKHEELQDVPATSTFVALRSSDVAAVRKWIEELV